VPAATTEAGFRHYDEADRIEVASTRQAFDRYEVRYYFGRRDEPVPGPEAFLVDLPPGMRAAAHFHPVDQFQVFFGAPGARYQRHPIGPLLVHYSDAFTTYGPFSTAAEPARLWTLRPEASAFTAYMPEDRARLTRRGTRTRHVDVEPSAATALDVGATATTYVWPPEADGLAVALLRAGPGGVVDGPASAGAQYYCVLDGTVLHDGRPYSRRSLGWSGPGQAGPTLAAGPDDGFAVLLLQFPHQPSVERTAREDEA